MEISYIGLVLLAVWIGTRVSIMEGKGARVVMEELKAEELKQDGFEQDWIRGGVGLSRVDISRNFIKAEGGEQWKVIRETVIKEEVKIVMQERVVNEVVVGRDGARVEVVRHVVIEPVQVVVKEIEKVKVLVRG